MGPGKCHRRLRRRGEEGKGIIHIDYSGTWTDMNTQQRHGLRSLLFCLIVNLCVNVRSGTARWLCDAGCRPRRRRQRRRNRRLVGRAIVATDRDEDCPRFEPTAADVSGLCRRRGVDLETQTGWGFCTAFAQVRSAHVSPACASRERGRRMSHDIDVANRPTFELPRNHSDCPFPYRSSGQSQTRSSAQNHRT